MSPTPHQLEMVTKGVSSPSSIIDGRELEDVMVSLFMFDWDDESVDSFITKLNATPREGLCFPENIKDHAPTVNNRGTFKNAILSHLVDAVECASVEYGNVVCKDQGSASRFSFKLATLKDQPWVQATLAQGNPLPGKLAKVTVAVRNVPVEAIPCANVLFH